MVNFYQYFVSFYCEDFVHKIPVNIPHNWSVSQPFLHKGHYCGPLGINNYITVLVEMSNCVCECGNDKVKQYNFTDIPKMA